MPADVAGAVAMALRYASAAGLGVFAGANLTEGSVLVPYWRSLPPDGFFAWYRANDARLLGFFGPLTAVVALATLAAAGASFGAGDASRWWTLAASGLTFAAVAMFPLYFQGANARFSAASIPPDDLPGELARWAAWHRVRTVLAAAALAAGLVALR